jgi:hypothetical protein
MCGWTHAHVNDNGKNNNDGPEWDGDNQCGVGGIHNGAKAYSGMNLRTSSPPKK